MMLRRMQVNLGISAQFKAAPDPDFDLLLLVEMNEPLVME